MLLGALPARRDGRDACSAPTILALCAFNAGRPRRSAARRCHRAARYLTSAQPPWCSARLALLRDSCVAAANQRASLKLRDTMSACLATRCGMTMQVSLPWRSSLRSTGSAGLAIRMVVGARQYQYHAPARWRSMGGDLFRSRHNRADQAADRVSQARQLSVNVARRFNDRRSGRTALGRNRSTLCQGLQSVMRPAGRRRCVDEPEPFGK